MHASARTLARICDARTLAWHGPARRARALAVARWLAGICVFGFVIAGAADDEISRRPFTRCSHTHTFGYLTASSRGKVHACAHNSRRIGRVRGRLVRAPGELTEKINAFYGVHVERASERANELARAFLCVSPSSQWNVFFLAGQDILVFISKRRTHTVISRNVCRSNSICS